MSKGKKANSQRDRRGRKHREKIHHMHVRWLDKKEQEREDLIKDVTIVGSCQKLSERFTTLSIVKANAKKAEREKLANTSLKDIIK